MRLFVLVVLMWSTATFAINKSICGSSDDRVISNNPKVGRGLLSANAKDACTFTLISPNCAVSAGHCYGYSSIVEFNTPLSINGWLQRSKPEDVYLRDEVIAYDDRGPGMDFLVVKLKANEITGKLPGDIQGFYSVSYSPVELGTLLVVYGYGTSRDPQTNFAQQVSYGPIIAFDKRTNTAEHRVDTTSGNSGSSLISEETGEVIGVHTHGGCLDSDSFPRSSNYGTLLANNETFRNAVTKCLETALP